MTGLQLTNFIMIIHCFIINEQLYLINVLHLNAMQTLGLVVGNVSDQCMMVNSPCHSAARERQSEHINLMLYINLPFCRSSARLLAFTNFFFFLSFDHTLKSMIISYKNEIVYQNSAKPTLWVASAADIWQPGMQETCVMRA